MLLDHVVLRHWSGHILRSNASPKTETWENTIPHVTKSFPISKVKRRAEREREWREREERESVRGQSESLRERVERGGKGAGRGKGNEIVRGERGERREREEEREGEGET